MNSTLQTGEKIYLSDMRGERQDLEAIFRAGLSAVHGSRCVAAYLEKNPLDSRTCVVAIGKAASAMATGALQALGEQFHRGFLVTRDDHIAPAHLRDARFSCMEAGHPVPDARSLQAGDSLCRFLETVPADAGILLLVSGGASSLVEVLPESTGLEQLQQLNHWLIASGLDITAINRVRRCVSRIKGGGLVKYIQGRKATVLLISDVAGDDPAIIGSGLLYRGMSPGVTGLDLPGWILKMTDSGSHMPAPAAGIHGQITHHVVASLDLALQAAARKGRELGYSTGIMDEPLEGEAADAGARLVEQLRDSQAGLYLWGGETTVTLPANPGKGGRNQQLALAAACAMVDGDTIVLLSAGTDGTDGSTLAAGAVVDPATITRGAAAGLDCGQCLKKADSGPYLEVCGDVFVTGPTGTNVTDMVIGIKLDENL